MLALIPRVPRPVPATGIVDGRAAFRGTLHPRTLTSDGRVSIRDATVESIPLGEVAANWQTQGGDVVIDPVTARPLSGRFVGRATIPGSPGRPTRVDATFADIQSDQLADVLTHRQLKVTGSAGGKLDATIPADPKALAVDLTLRAPDLTVQGVPVGTVSAMIRGKGEVIEYELTADGATGKVRFQGSVPLGGPAPEKPANAEIRVADFGPAEIARLLGIDGFPAELKGRAAIDANLRALRPDPTTVAAHGFVEIRDLRWGDRLPLGDLRGIVERTADWWRIDDLRGDLLGGVASGVARGVTPARGPRTVGFRLDIDRAVLARLLASAPWLAQRAEGFGTLRLSGQMEETFAGSGERGAFGHAGKARRGRDRRSPTAGRVRLLSGRGSRHDPAESLVGYARGGSRAGLGVAPVRARQVVRAGHDAD